MAVIISVKFHHKGLTIFKIENSNFVIFKYMWFPWQRRLSWKWYMLQKHWLMMVIICEKFDCERSNRFRENWNLKNFVYFCRYHGNGSHIETCRHFIHQFKLPWPSLWSFIMIGPTISEKLFGQNYWKKKNNNKETDQKQYLTRPSVGST
jgi:hypothetical protein